MLVCEPIDVKIGVVILSILFGLCVAYIMHLVAENKRLNNLIEYHKEKNEDLRNKIRGNQRG